MGDVIYTDEEFDEFDRITARTSSPSNLIRIEARMDIKKFVAKHGEEKCNVMFEELKRRDAAQRKSALRRNKRK